MSVSREGVDALLDHAVAKTKAMDRVELCAWFAVDVLLDVEAAYAKWGPPPMPRPELDVLLAAVRHAIAINLDPPPETPGDGVATGEGAAPSLGPATDIAVEDDISGAFADLKLTDDEDGRP